LQLGENLRKARKAKGFTQKVLADITGLEQSYISHIERGLKTPTIPTLSKLAEALGTTASALMDEHKTK
jgi:transcriptional regulator with XRE-family HTH domain